MGFQNLSLTIIILRALAAFSTLTLHEMVKARVSTALGDPTPKSRGYLSDSPFKPINPLKHIEPIGFIVAIIFGFGWGHPTPTSPLYYKERQKGVFITYLTPSLVNLFAGLLVALFAGTMHILMLPGQEYQHVILNTIGTWSLVFLRTFAQMSVATALFNMIPVPPLDAAKLLQVAVSPGTAIKLTQNEKLLQLILMLLIVMGVVGGIINTAASHLVWGIWTW